MSTTTWHVPDALWDTYARGRLDPIAEAAVEQHVVGCTSCQRAAGAHLDGPARNQPPAPAPGADRTAATPRPARPGARHARASVASPTSAESTWPAIQAEIARPPLPRPLRWAVRRGLREDDATLLAIERDLTLSSAVALVAATSCALLVGMLDGRPPFTADLVFLLLAPLVPLLAVVATYDATDPLRELTATTPFSALRLALLRAAVALGAAVPLTALIGVLLPGVGPAAAAWLLPGTALAAAGLVLLTWTTARVAALVAGLVWVGVTLLARDQAVLTLTTPAGQLVTAAVLAALFLLLVLRTSGHTSIPGVQP